MIKRLELKEAAQFVYGEYVFLAAAHIPFGLSISERLGCWIVKSVRPQDVGKEHFTLPGHLCLEDALDVVMDYAHHRPHRLIPQEKLSELIAEAAIA